MGSASLSCEKLWPGLLLLLLLLPGPSCRGQHNRLWDSHHNGCQCHSEQHPGGMRHNYTDNCTHSVPGQTVAPQVKKSNTSSSFAGAEPVAVMLRLLLWVVRASARAFCLGLRGLRSSCADPLAVAKHDGSEDICRRMHAASRHCRAPTQCV